MKPNWILKKVNKSNKPFSVDENVCLGLFGPETEAATGSPRLNARQPEGLLRCPHLGAAATRGVRGAVSRARGHQLPRCL